MNKPVRHLLTLAALAGTLAGCEPTNITTEAGAPEPAVTTAPVQPLVPVTAPVTTRATTPPTTAKPVTEGPLGSSFTVSPGDRKITAFTFRPAVEPANRYSTPKAGMQFASVEVQECAGAAGERFSPNRFDFELALTDNTRVRAGIEVTTPQLASSPLLPGDCIRGWVSFEVPTTGTVRHVVYSEGNASAKWLVA